jgi:hypothetical protein
LHGLALAPAAALVDGLYVRRTAGAGGRWMRWQA